MIRKILEAIDEKEFTPRQDVVEPDSPSELPEIEEALRARGWHLTEAGPSGGGHTLLRYVHNKVPGYSILLQWDTGKAKPFYLMTAKRSPAGEWKIDQYTTHIGPNVKIAVDVAAVLEKNHGTAAKEAGDPALTAVRQAILEVLHDEISPWEGTDEQKKARVEKDTYTGESDPGGWAPNALVTVHHESGVPGPLSESPGIAELWLKVDARASEILGQDIFGEPVNSAVTAFYEG